MKSDLALFGAVHLGIIATILLCAAGLALWSYRSPLARTPIRLALGTFLLINEVVWYCYRLTRTGVRLPDVLPFQLCDLAVWLAIVAAFTLKPWAFEIAYFTALGGGGMAILTPDLWAPLRSYPTAYFFLAHGGAVITVTCLAWGKQAELRRGSVWRVFGILNLYAAAVGIFNACFRTNYMYLCRKPAGASLLDYLGPWPVYLLAGEAVALAVLALLWLPFRGVPKTGAPRDRAVQYR